MSFELFLQILIVGLNLGAFYCLLALGLTLMYGIMGVLNMAHGAIYMVGAVATFFVYQQIGIDFYLSLVLVTITTGILGFIIECKIF